MEKRIVVDDGNVYNIVKSEIKRLGNKADLNHIDVSGVTNMWMLFNGSDFNGDISNWNVGNVENMSWMFRNSKFNGDISGWDVSNVEDMYSMFRNSKFNQDISGWDVSNVKDMNSMFASSQFNQDISNWDVSNVEDMYRMFEDSIFDKNIDMWNYNFKAVEEKPYNFDLSTTGSYTLIEKYVKALENKKFDLAEKIKFKMKGIRFNYRYKDIEESKHLVSMDSNLLKEFKEYLWKRR